MNEMRDLICRLFAGITMWVVAVFPLLLAVACALPCFFGGWGCIWDGHDYDFYFLPHISRNLLGGGLCFVILAIVFSKLCRLYCAHPKVSGALGMFLTALLLRMVIVAALSNVVSPVCDFAQSWERACCGDAIVVPYCSHLLYPAWMNYSMFEYILASVFGEHFIVVLFTNAVFDAVTAAMIYYIAFMLFRCRSVATIASLLYAFYPTSLAYVLTATPEHLSIACFAVVAASFIAYVTREISLSKIYLYSFAVGVVAGVGNSMKPILLIYFAAMSICLVVDVLLCTDNRIHKMRKHFFVFGCFIASQICTSGLVLWCTESVFHVDLSHVDPTPHYFCIGLNRQGEGQIHLGSLSRQWTLRMVAGCSRDRANKEVFELIVDDWRGNLDQILPFFLKKMVWAWQDDNVPFKYLIDQVGPKAAMKFGVDKDEVQLMSTCMYRPEASQRVKWMDVIRQSIQTGAFIWYFATMLFGVIGGVWYARTHSAEWHYVFVCILILGYAGMIALGEAQSRYKCLIMPYVFVLIAPFVTRYIILRNMEK